MGMMMSKVAKSDLTQLMIKEYLSYDNITGHLTWIKRPSKKVHKGRRAGYLLGSGYRAITLFGTSYQEHHLIWFLVYGLWVDEIDHINHDKSDNSLDNLRSVTHAENAKNMKQLSNTITGEQGIHYDRTRGRYTATIRSGGKVIFSKSCSDENQEDIDNLIQQREAKLTELGFHTNHGK